MPEGARRPTRTHVYGHRGSRRPGPENTSAAVRAALMAGADGVEIDVRRDRAGVLVVSHDPVVGRPEPLERVLDTVLDLAGRGAGPERDTPARVVLEVKNRPGDPDYDAPVAATARALVALLAARHGSDDVVVSSFDISSLLLVRALGGPPTALLTGLGASVRAGIGTAVAQGHAELHPHWASLTARRVARAHAAGLRLVAWTVPSVPRARRLAGWGVDALICDDPATVVAALAGELSGGVGLADDDP
ncbi:MAG TPA: glycerophosphodiester phosphodiesterase [Mycobacteriales bacterium]|nr:glycerophosphodiester phosphodiesterase [Mycobacteriales bacterium]